MNSAQPHSATWCSSPRLISVITHTREASSRGQVFIAAQKNHPLYSIWICTFYISVPRLSTVQRKSGCLFVHLMQREHQIKKYGAWLSKEPPQECLLLAMIAPCSFKKAVVMWWEEDEICLRIDCVMSNKQDFGSSNLQRRSGGDGGTKSQKRTMEHFQTCVQNGKVPDKSLWNWLFSLSLLLIPSSSFN